MTATQLRLETDTAPPRKSDLAKPIYSEAYCAGCGQQTAQLWQPGHWWKCGRCGYEEQVDKWVVG